MLPRNELLKKIVEKSGLQQEEFGLSVGVKKASFNNYIHGRRDIPNTLIEKLASVHGINPAYFFKERAPMYLYDVLRNTESKSEQSLTERQQKTIDRYMAIKSKEKVDDYVDMVFTSEGQKDTYKEEYSSESMPYYHIPDYGIQAMAGTGVINGDGMEGTIKVPALPKSDYDYPITVVGDSMEPKYHDGDVIFVKKQNHLEHGETGIFETENGMVVKKFYNVPEESVQLLSLNKKYQPITEGILRIEGKVVE